MSIARPLLAAALMLALTMSPHPARADEAGSPAAGASAAEPALPTDFAGLVGKLNEADYSEKRELLDAMIAAQHPNTPALLKALLEEHLYARDADGRVFITDEQADGLHLTNVLSLSAEGVVANDEGLSKIGTNNALRKYLRGAIARFRLADPDRRQRLAAVHEMLRDADEATTALMRARLEIETDTQVKAALAAGIALADLDSSDAAVRLAAVQSLAGSLDGDVYNRLKTMTSANADGSPAEADDAVRSAATIAVAQIERWRTFYGSIETLFFGLSLGSVLVLAAIGLAITFGVMGVINMAHGELIMLGAYTAYVMQQLMPAHLTASILLSIPAAFLVSAIAGIAMERSVVRFLYGRPLETLLATFGISLILQQVVRSIFSPLNRSVAAPEFLSGTLVINDALSLTYNRLYIVGFTLLVFAALQLILKRTALGLKARAVSQNRAMARAMGIKSEWVDAITFGLGSGIAGVAGVALSQLTNVGPNLGQGYIIDSFMVVVFGGVGNLWGTLIGGMSLGVANKLLEPAVGAVMAKIAMLVFIILFIQRRKQGLFPQKGRAAEGH